jgi:sterol desaturase/sphingolipid hydroxylase (fatty acid hydroxylase superfamily)
MALLVKFDLPTPFLLTSLFNAWDRFIHLNAPLYLGPLRWLWVDNRYHRIHHSRLPEHYNCNFAGFFSAWDWMFGTQRMPRDDEFPEVGLSDRDEPQSVRDYLYVVPLKTSA